jgi:hypothetical protein
MLFFQFAYLLLLILCCGYASFFGGKTGRAGSLIFLSASLLSMLAASWNPAWLGTSIGVLFVDVICLGALMYLATNSTRYWPIWATGLQIAGVVSHLGMFFAPDILPTAYWAIVAFWSVPILLIMVIGTALDKNYERQLR